MSRYFSIFASFLLLTSASLARADVETCSLDEVYQTPDLRCDVTITNRENAPLRISDFRALNHGDKTETTDFDVAPQSSRQVAVHLDLLGDEGESIHYFSFRSNDEPAGFEVRGFVSSVLDQYRPAVDFGAVNVEDLKQTSRQLPLSSRDSPAFRVVKVVKAPGYVNARVSTTGDALVVRLKPDTAWGIHRDTITLELDSPLQKYARVAVEADVHGSVVPEINPYGMGLVRQGTTQEAKIRIVNRRDGPLRLGKIELHGLAGKVVQEECSPATKSCRIITFKMDDTQPLGTIKGDISIDLPVERQTLRVFVWGLHLKSDAIVKDINEELTNQTAAADAASKDAPVKLATLLNQATSARPAPEPPPGKGPLLKWRVENEQMLHAYAVYRSDAEQGRYVRIGNFVPVDNAGEGAGYQWRDNSAESGKSYWYYVGVVYRTGRKESLTSPQQVVAR